jgi:hypothetical protein
MSLIGCSEHSSAVLNGAFDAIPYLDEPQRQGFNSPGTLGGQPWGDHLFQARQPIQDPTRCIGRQRAMSSWHASPGLLESGNCSRVELMVASIQTRVEPRGHCPGASVDPTDARNT